MLISNEQSGKWLAKAKQRVVEQRKFAFTDEMVHVENSPQYQETVLRLFCSIAEFLSKFDDLDGIKLYNDVKRSLEFLTWTIKPTGYMAEIGDSDGSLSCTPIVNRRFERFGNSYLNYAATLGRG